MNVTLKRILHHVAFLKPRRRFIVLIIPILKLISNVQQLRKAWKTLKNIFKSTTSVKRTKLYMLASNLEGLVMDEGKS